VPELLGTSVSEVFKAPAITNVTCSQKTLIRAQQTLQEPRFSVEDC